jgi:3'-phosphoadenosine 5'-phosphosulfate sulfotransferase (PAPS reductase)/FAD synthetase
MRGRGEVPHVAHAHETGVQIPPPQMKPHHNTSLREETLFGVVDLVEDAIALLKKHEPEKGYYLAFPTRIIRYCCDKLKERGGGKRWKILGVRAEESAKRAERRVVSTFDKIICPILHWKEYHVWDYIDAYKLPHCSLYDEGRSRLGCVMCPMQNRRARLKDAERYPNFYKAYMSAFAKMIAERKRKGLPDNFGTAERVMEWWLER